MNDQLKVGAAASAAPVEPKKPAVAARVFLVFDKNVGITIRGADKRMIRRQAEDRLMVLDPSVADEKAILDYLDKPGVLDSFNGKRIGSLSEASAKMTLGQRLDELLAFSDAQLLALVPKGKRNKVQTRGDILAAIIEKES